MHLYIEYAVDSKTQMAKAINISGVAMPKTISAPKLNVSAHPMQKLKKGSSMKNNARSPKLKYAVFFIFVTS